ncbi:MAG: hypothetical protein JWO92_1062 [Chitinophagaceae bacterium]|nr:hypothetical protein [Chitinophagaceae bacterium]
MIDTIRIHIPFFYIFQRPMVCKININDATQCYGEGITRYSGNYKNFNITQNGFGTYFSGSICKYFHGENFSTLTRLQFIAAIKQLSQELEIDFKRGHITRLDIAENLPMVYKPSYYNDCIISYPRLSKNTYGNTTVELSGNKKKKTKLLKFYSKNAEAIARETPIPIQYQNVHLYRYEISIAGHVKTALKLDIENVSSLYTVENYCGLINFWSKEFGTITLAETAPNEERLLLNCKPNDRVWLQYILNCKSEATAIRSQQKLFINGEMTSSQFRSVKTKINRLCKDYLTLGVNNISLKDELVQAVKAAVTRNITNCTTEDRGEEMQGEV